jgi:RNA polymerase sigma-70 factor, ECF subfamily
MERIAAAELALDPALTDDEVVRRVRAGETRLYEVLMRRHNRTVYRAIRALIRNEAEVEDAMQGAYLNAFARLDQFRGEARFSTWLVSIALNEARARLRRHSTEEALEEASAVAPPPGAVEPERAGPEEEVSARELVMLTERAVDRLPPDLRTTFMLRAVEGLDTADAAAALGVSEDVVKTRLHRARAHLRTALAEAAEQRAQEAYAFPATRCDRVVAGVLATIGRERVE